MCKIHQFLKIGIVLSIFIASATQSSVAQQKRLQKVQAFYDSTAIPELFHHIPIGFRFIFADQSAAATRGFLDGKVSWKNIKVRSPQGTIQNRKLHFRPEKVWRNNHQVTFMITYADTTVTCNLPLPYLQKIHFNLYTDSIKRGIRFYLNIEGTFSSGRVYPLDTGKLRFFASAGSLTNNILRISKADSATKNILVKSRVKWDTNIADSIMVPVKTHIKVADLPTEDELFREWKRERKEN